MCICVILTDVKQNSCFVLQLINDDVILSNESLYNYSLGENLNNLLKDTFFSQTYCKP